MAIKKSQILEKEAIRLEYIKCAADPAYFMRNYCVIQDVAQGKIKFNLYPYQEKVLNAFMTHKYNIVLKSRQLGISTLCAGYALWLMLFNTDKYVLVVATDRETSRQMITKVKIMNQFLPEWLRFDGKDMEENNKLSLRFPNGSQISAISSDPNAARGRAVSLLILDEAAFIEDADLLWTSAYPTLSKSGGSAIVLSSPNGVGGFFYNLWKYADPNLGEEYNLFNRIFLPWHVHPERDDKWLMEQEKALGRRKALQEVHAQFLGSGDTLIDIDKIIEYEKKYKMEPIEKRYNNLYIFKYVENDKKYIISADNARGDGSDYSAFHVIEVDSCEQVAEFKGKIDPQTFANILVNLAHEYNEAYLVVENNNVGNSVLQEIFNREYKNIYYTKNNGAIYDIKKEIMRGTDLSSKNQIPGFTMSMKTRPVVIATLEQYIRENMVIIHGQRTLDELKTFVWIDGKVQAQKDCNDDLCISLGMGLYARDTNLKLIQEGIKFQKIVLDNFRVLNRSTSGEPMEQWNMKIGKQEHFDLRILLK